MDPGVLEHALRDHRLRCPSHAVTIELADGTQVLVDDPSALIVRAGGCAYVSKEGFPVLFNAPDVRRIVDHTAQLELPVSHKSRWIVAALLAAVVVSVTTWIVFVTMPAAEHRRWYDEVEYLILELAARKPPDVATGHWSMCLMHTWNLHSNYGNRHDWTIEAQRTFVVEFRFLLRREVTLETIDAVWDAYIDKVPRAARYNHYRPSEWLSRGEDYSDSELDWMLQRLQERRQKQGYSDSGSLIETRQ